MADAPVTKSAAADVDPAAAGTRVRTLVHGLDALRRGVPAELRLLLGHPMDTGLQHDGHGKLVPRKLVTRFECRLDGALVFAADLYPAIAANPYLAFWLRADTPGMLRLEWWGDAGFHHIETRAIQLA